MPTGKLKWFDVAKGFGFIVPDDGGRDVYLSAKALEAARLPTLTPGMALSYQVTQVRGRTAAASVSITRAEQTIDPNEDFEREWGLRRG